MKLRVLCLIFLTFSVTLFSCKKDKSPESKLADAKKQIIGNWQVQNTVFTYYDASGKVVETENSNTSNGQSFQFINDTTIITSGSPDGIPYTLTNVGDKVMLNAGSQSFELKFSNSSAMSWSLERQEDGTKYAKSVSEVQLKKQ